MNWTLQSHPEFMQVKEESVASGGDQVLPGVTSRPVVWTFKSRIETEELVSSVRRINEENNIRDVLYKNRPSRKTDFQ